MQRPVGWLLFVYCGGVGGCGIACWDKWSLRLRWRDWRGVVPRFLMEDEVWILYYPKIGLKIA